MPPVSTPLHRFAPPWFGFREPAIHGAARLQASCLTVGDVAGGAFASLRLSFIDPRGRHATMVAYFDAAATDYAHVLARAINAAAARDTEQTIEADAPAPAAAAT